MSDIKNGPAAPERQEPETASEKQFCGNQLKPEYSGFKKSRVVMVPCPYDVTACYQKGTKDGPAAILDASEHMELLDDELKVETFKIGIHTEPPLDIAAKGPEEMVTTVKTAVLDILKSEKLPIVIGGEHSVSIGAVRAITETYKDNVSVLHFDAHHDLKDEYEGHKLSHACVARRFLESCPVVQVGQRSFSRDEHEFINTNPPGLKIFDVYDIIENALWKELALKSLKENVYISLDLDVFDPSLVQSVGTPEPGGIGWYELLDLIKMVAKSRKIVGFDVVELMPIKGLVGPDFLAAKLIYRMIGYIFHNSKIKD